MRLKSWWLCTVGLVVLTGSCGGTPGGQSAASVELLLNDPLTYQTPADRCEAPICTRLLDLINGARMTIDFAAYGMRNQTVLLEALEAAQSRGVRVRGVVDRDADGMNYYTSTDEWVQRLGDVRDDWEAERTLNASAGDSEPYVPLCPRPEGFAGPLQCLAYDLGDQWLLAAHASREDFTDPEGEGGSNRIMHDKFFVVDGRWVWTGSANLSDSDTGGYSANAAVVIDSPAVASVFGAEFESLWAGRFHQLKESDGVEVLQVGDAEVTTWFSPQNDAMRYGVEALLAQATDRIDIAVFYLTNKYVTAELIAAHQRGVQVRVIVDATSAVNGYTKHELLRVAGIPLKVENWGGKMHMKAAAVDGQYLIVGSMNWTAAGEDTNDENTLIIRSDRLAGEFEGFFDDLWSGIPDEWAATGARPAPESMVSSTACTDGIDNDFDELVDLDDSGCSSSPPPLGPLPPHWLVSKAESPEPPDGYRRYWPSTCDAAYPDWYVCIPPPGLPATSAAMNCRIGASLCSRQTLMASIPTETAKAATLPDCGEQGDRGASRLPERDLGRHGGRERLDQM